MSEINHSIRCKISNCKHHDTSEYCTLSTIDISGKCDCTDCRETECKSFELK